MPTTFGRKLTNGFQSIGKKLGKINAQTLGRKFVNSASKIDGIVQRVGGMAMLVEPELAPMIGSGMALSHATNTAIQSGSALAKKRGGNSKELERFAADYGHAKNQYSQLGKRNSLEKPQPIRSAEPQLDFA